MSEATNIHPAKTMPFEDLYRGLEAARAAGLVRRKDDAATGRALYCYTERCVYENGWNEFSLIARGLIIHSDGRRVIATPFPKFFNAGERGAPVPGLPFETFEKLDGSLAIIHFFGGRWRVATKGSFDSSQALWAEAQLAKQSLSALTPNCTYLAEAIYPENRIVVHYDKPALVLLGAYDETGRELSTAELSLVGIGLGWRTAETYSYGSFAELAATACTLPVTAEGFVMRFSNGYRLKMKGAEYRRIHSLISRCTPLAMWEAMAAGDDMQAIRRDLPEEFWADFDLITQILLQRILDLTKRISDVAGSVSCKSDKELGLSLHLLPDDVRPFVFAWRKAGGRIEGKTKQSLYRSVRPTANILPGYTPSYAMNRIMDEAA